MSQRMNLCPLDGRYREATEDLRNVWGDCHLMRHRVYIELKWLEFFVDRIDPKGPLTDEQRRALQPLYEMTSDSFSRIVFFEQKTNHDVKAIEYYLKERLRGLPAVSHLAEKVHIFCTSEDINNLAYALMVQAALAQVLLPCMQSLQAELKNLVLEHADTPLLARTHGQPATPTTFGKEFAVYRHRLNRHIQRLETFKPLGKFNGAVGNFNAHVVAFPQHDWPQLAEAFVKTIGLDYQPLSTQIECHDWLSEMDLLALRRVEAEVGSSTMPHKINPIDFENAEGNLGLSTAMLRFFSGKLPVSRLQRDLSDSTCLRSVGCALGYMVVGLKSCIKGLEKSTVNKEAACAELANHWEVLGEPIQTVLRREGHPDAYEKLKDLTRGRRVSPDELHQFLEECKELLSEEHRQRLASLTPETYVGLASQLARSQS
ncbi:hypothetical protein Esti_004227 [Eimeria stiedai]